MNLGGICEENTSTPNEPTDLEPIKKFSVPETASEVVDDKVNDKQDNSDYDFDEMDEEEEILPSTIEKQNEVEILPQEGFASRKIFLLNLIRNQQANKIKR